MRRKLSLRDLRQRPLLVAAGLVTIGLVAVLAGPWDRTAQSSPPAGAGHRTFLAVVAAHTLSAGSIIGAEDLETKPTSSPVSSGTGSKDDIVGRITSRRFTAGEAITRDGLRDAATLGIAARVPSGERAFAIRVAEDDIVGGFLQSGDHVDVFATIPGSVFPSKNAGDVLDRSRVVLLLQNVAVLAVGENPATRGSVQASARTVSLALAPEGLARLALALRYGKVSLAIRTPGDNAVAHPVDAVLEDLLPFNAPAPAKLSARPRPRRFSGIPFYAGTRSAALSLGGSPR